MSDMNAPSGAESGGNALSTLGIDSAPAAAPADNAATDTSLSQGQQQSTEGQQSPQDWMSQYNDQAKEFVTKKGFKDPNQIIESYTNLEKRMGAPADEIFRIGKEPTPEDIGKIYDRLGRPETPDNYKLESGENDIPGLVDWLKSSAHENGLNNDQVNKMYSEFNEHIGKLNADAVAKIESTNRESLEALKRESGTAWERNNELATRAADYLGMSEGMLTAVRDAGMSAEMLQILSKAGSMMAEGQMIGANANDARAHMGGMTLQEAQSKKSQLMGDSNFNSRLNSSDIKVRSEANNELLALNKVISDSKRRN